MRKYLAEFIGTTLLVFFGCAISVTAAVLLSAMSMLPAAFCTLTVAVGFGLLVTVLTLAFGKISGGHLNPAISAALWMSGKLQGKDLIGYLVGQFAGGIAGAGLLAAVFGGRRALGANGYDTLSILGSQMWVVFLVEALMTFTLIMVVLAVRDRENQEEPAEFKPAVALYTGLATAAVYLFGYPFSGASANPARSFGPALLQEGDALSQVWLFILAPIIGACVAAVLYKAMTLPKKEAVSALPESEESLEEAAEEAAEDEVSASEAEKSDEAVEPVEEEETVKADESAE